MRTAKPLKPSSLRVPTGSDVARLAGVSKSAVSRAYTGGVVSEESRKRILAAARTLKYRPNGAARSLTTSRSHLIGVAITHLDNQFYPEVIERLSERLSVEGYRMVLFVTHGETNLEPVTDELLGLRLDGVVLASSGMATHVAAECLEIGVPVIMFNNVDPAGLAPGISADNAHGARLLAEHLLSTGHRRFGVITGVAESSTSSERADAFVRAIRNAGCPAPRLITGDFSLAGAMRATASLLDDRPEVDAIFCVNDHMALGALQVARSRGLMPGRDISIVGFDDVAIASWPAFDLTTYAQPVSEMVECVISRLIAAIGGKTLEGGTVRLSGQLCVRGSSRSRS